MVKAEVLLQRNAGEGEGGPNGSGLLGGFIACLGFAVNPKGSGEPLECFRRGGTRSGWRFRKITPAESGVNG